METKRQADAMIRVMLMNGQAYAVALSAKQTIQAAKDIHSLTKTTAAALGRVMMAALLCASDIKAENGNVTISFSGGGPAGRAMAVAAPDGTVRATVMQPKTDLPIRADGKLDVSGVLGVNGRLTVIKDNGDEPYIGQVQIQSGEVGEDMAYYYAMSEQRPSLIFLGVVIDKDQSVKSAGGLAVFPLPDCEPYVLDALEARIDEARRLSSMLASGQTICACLEEIFKGMDMKANDSVPLSYACPCSQDRMERALISLGKKELIKLIEEDGQAELTCHFCNTRYYFDRPALQALYQSART